MSPVNLPDWLDLIQWPATVVTILASGFVGSLSEQRRKWGFYLFVVSNFLWIGWGVYSHAYALIVLQVALFIMNVRGAYKADEDEKKQT